MKIDVFGSCITRDAFELENSEHEVNAYYSRSSLVSVVHRKTEIKEDIDLEHNFLKRSVIQDLNKKFRSYSRNPKAKVLVVDLIQERYSLNILDDAISTYSGDYRRAKLPAGKLINGERQLMLFKRYIRNISQMLSSYDLVILHEANLTDRFKNESGEYEKLKLLTMDKFFIDKGDEYYRILRENLEKVETIKIDGYYADTNHKWGVSPSHYERGYYEEFLVQLDKILVKHFD